LHRNRGAGKSRLHWGDCLYDSAILAMRISFYTQVHTMTVHIDVPAWLVWAESIMHDFQITVS
jgi:hypothetical protein